MKRERRRRSRRDTLRKRAAEIVEHSRASNHPSIGTLGCTAQDTTRPAGEMRRGRGTQAGGEEVGDAEGRASGGLLRKDL